MRAACLMCVLTACVEQQVPTERMPIRNVGRGHLVKGDASLDGFTCGERYETAVAGVREAEDEMRACWQANAVYGGGIVGALLLVPAAMMTDHYGGSHDAVDTELGVAAGMFLVGYVAAWIAGNHLNNAIRIYNRAVP